MFIECYISSTVLKALRIFLQIIVTATLWDRYYLWHYMDEQSRGTDRFRKFPKAAHLVR